MTRALLLRRPVPVVRAMAASSPSPSPPQPPPAAAPMVAVKRRVAGAIQIGAPLFNEGNIAGCEKVYRETYTALLADPECQKLEKVTEVLTAQMEALEEGQPDRNAWQLRHGFDSIMAMYDTEAHVHSAAEEPEAVGETLPLVTIDSHTAASFMCAINDDVMGGVSEGVVGLSEEHMAGEFAGTVRTDNNGGFASIQMRVPQSFVNMSEYAGFYVDCCCPEEADAGKVFQLVAKDGASLPAGVSFKVPFTAPPGTELRRVLVPFGAFDRPEQMGRRVNWPEMDRSMVREVGIMVLRPEVGPFRLLVREIGIYQP